MAKIAIILGTRPEIIKLSPLIDALKDKAEVSIIHSGQHYDFEMDRVFFKELRLPAPMVELNVGSGTQGKQTAKSLSGIEDALIQIKPDLVIVQGDTNTTLAGALAARKMGITLAHVEAGCRSFNKDMPEETNRIVADHLSDFLFAMDKECVRNLLREGLPKERIHLVGNTGIDAALRSAPYANEKILTGLGLEPNAYCLATVHRAQNTDDPRTLKRIITALGSISKASRVVLPMHPRLRQALIASKLSLPESIQSVPPLGYLDLLALLKHATLVLTDSGGLQEEAALLDIPCLVLRDETEYVELQKAGKLKLVGTQEKKIESIAAELLKKGASYKAMRSRKSGLAGGASEKIASILLRPIRR